MLGKAGPPFHDGRRRHRTARHRRGRSVRCVTRGPVRRVYLHRHLSVARRTYIRLPHAQF